MYDWIIEADIHRYNRALRTEENRADRERLTYLRDRAKQRLATARLFGDLVRV